MKTIITISLFVILSLVFYFFRKDTGLFDYKELSFENSKIFFTQDTSLPYITYSATFANSGSFFDPSQKKGLSLLTSYMQDQGAGNLSSEELQEKLNYYGTEIDVQVGRENIELSLSGLSLHKKELWNLFLKVLFEPRFSKKELEILKKQLVESRLKSLDNPSFVISEAWMRELFGNRYMSPKAGTLKSLKQISIEDIQDFYMENHRKASMLITVVGNYDSKFKKIIKKSLQPLLSKKPNKNFASIKSRKSSHSMVIITNKDLVQSQIALGYVTQPYPIDSPKQAITLSLINSVLGGSRLDSKLMLNLRDKQGLTYGVYSHFLFSKKLGYFSISGSTRSEMTKTFLEAAIKVFTDLQKNGLTEQDLQTAKNLLKSQFVKNIETAEGRMEMLQYYVFYLGLDRAFLHDYIRYIDQVSMEDVRAGLEKFVDSSKLQVVIYGNPQILSQFEDKQVFNISFKKYFSEDH